MGVRSDVVGLLEYVFSIGKNLTIKLKNATGILQIRNKADDEFAIIQAKKANDSATPSNNDLITFQDLNFDEPLVEFIILDGDYTAGTNTGKIGYSSVTAGAYTNKKLYYDDGTIVHLIRHVKKFRTSYTGTLTPLNNSFSYIWDNSEWRATGDGAGGNTGALKALLIPFDFEDTTVTSTATILEDSIIHSVNIIKNPAFDSSAPELSVSLPSLTLMSSTQNDLTDTIQDEVSVDRIVAGANEGVVTVTINADYATAGAGNVVIIYSPSQVL